MNNVEYKTGDVISSSQFLVSSKGKKIVIPHVTNNRGAWGAGFVLALSKCWDYPEQEYKDFIKSSKIEDRLGQVQIVNVERNLYVANMCAQTLGEKSSEIPLKYWALEECLMQLGVAASMMGLEVCAPRFGAGLAGGSWKKIEELIKEYLIQENNLKVTVYDL